METTTTTRFQHCNSPDVIVLYEKDFVIIRVVNGKNKNKDEIYIKIKNKDTMI